MSTSSHIIPSGGKELPAGTCLEEFVIERVLGSGGFGITYLARDTRLDRQVVIKENLPNQFAHRDTTSLVVRPGAGRDDIGNFRWSMENFSREAATLAALNHPGIVQVLRSFEAYGTAYFVMPFVKGRTLDDIAREHRELGRNFPENELTGFLERVLEALGHLHGHGIYHRDIKPANILITSKGLPVIIDFGSARQRLSEKSMTVVESAGYTPLEQLQSHGNVGPWSDIYALGATLLKIMTGRMPPLPMDRIGEDPVENLLADSGVKSHYTEGFIHGVKHALNVHHTERWQTTEEWLGFLREGSVPGRMASPVASAGRMAPKPDSPSKQKPVRMTGKIGLLAGAVLIAVAWFVFDRTGSGGSANATGLRNAKPQPDKGSVAVASSSNSKSSEPRSPVTPSEPKVEPRLAAAFLKLDRLMAEGDLISSTNAIDGLKHLEMNALEEREFDKIRLKFNELAAAARLNVEASLSPENAEARVDGTKVPASFPIEVKGFGEHSLVVSSEGYDPYETTVKVGESHGKLDLGSIKLRKRVDVAATAPAAPTAAPPAPPPAPSAPPATKSETEKRAALVDELKETLNAWILANGQNDRQPYARILDDFIDYQYVNGRRATRNEVLVDFEKNTTRWPIRSYSVRDNKFTWKDNGDKCEIGFSMDYNYSDHSGRRAIGITDISMDVRRSNSGWVICRFKEAVRRVRNDKKGM
jgi:serine/threonine protein kinase